MLGLDPLPWQRWLLIHALELRPDGRFRYRTVLVLVARQNGKTSIVEVKNLWKMFVLAAQVLGTAQNLDLSEESWNNAVEMVEGIEELAVEVKHVDKTNGKKALRLTNGARWKVAAASRKGGRGFSGDDINLDELREHHNWEAWGAVTKTTLARPNAQIWAYSNAGDDKSVVLNDLQAKARAVAGQLLELLGQAVVAEAEAITRTAAERGIDTSLGLFEWSVPDSVKCTCERKDSQPHTDVCQLADPDLHAMANPALGYTITLESLRAALGTDPDEVFLTECLCQHVPQLEGPSVLDPETWVGLADPDSQPGGELAFAVDISPARDWASIGLYSPREDGLGHVEVIDRRPGTDWIVARLVELKDRWDPVAIGLDAKGPAGSLLLDLEAAGIARPAVAEEPARGDLIVPTANEVAAACGQLADAITQRTLRHIDQVPLNSAVGGVNTRPLGDAYAWGRKKSATDISPLVAVTVARWAYFARLDKLATAVAPAVAPAMAPGTSDLWRPTQRLQL